MSEYFESIRKGAKEALAWEQGKRLPQGPAQALLKIIAYDSDAAIEALHKYSIL